MAYRSASAGKLILVVGPSGAGKDTLLAHAHTHFADNRRFAFPKRLITRSLTATGEQHIPINLEQLEELRHQNQLALFWRAHGLAYGISAEINDMMSNGQNVVINTSRNILQDAHKRYNNLGIIHVTAPTEILQSRLEERSRELPNEIAARLLHTYNKIPTSPNVITIENIGLISEILPSFILSLENLANNI